MAERTLENVQRSVGGNFMEIYGDLPAGSDPNDTVNVTAYGITRVVEAEVIPASGDTNGFASADGGVITVTGNVDGARLHIKGY